MCRLTLIDMPFLRNRHYLAYLLAMNSMAGNLDGTGYYLFNKKELVKSGEDAYSYFTNDKNDFLKTTASCNGIYHVRMASPKYKVIDPATKELIPFTGEHSHPFKYDNIIMAHNGTLTFSNGGIENENLSNLWKDKHVIDSQQYILAFKYFYDREQDVKLAFDITSSYFYGAHNFLLHLENTSLVYILRGSLRDLYYCTFFANGDIPIGFAINTSKEELIDLAVACRLQYKCGYKILPIPIDSLHSYKLGSYNMEYMGKIHEYSNEFTCPTYVRPIWNGNRADRDKGAIVIHPNYSTPYVDSYDKIFALASLAVDLNLNLTEMMLIYQLYNNIYSSLLSLGEREIEDLSKWLDAYSGDSECTKTWSYIINSSEFMGKPRTFVYETLNLSFPYFVNETKVLKSALAFIAKGD